MRMNPRNLALIGALIVVMIILIVVGTRTGQAPAEPTPVTEAESGPLLPDAPAFEEIAQFEVRELEQTPDPDATEEPTITPVATVAGPTFTPIPSGPAEMVMRKNADSFWVITEATYATDRGVDQVTATGTVEIVLDLQYTDRFAISEVDATLADFGLAEPQYEIVIATSETEQRVLLGDKNPGGTRYYVQTGDDADSVYLVTSDVLDNVVNFIENPPYVPPPTPTATPTSTPNPFSEVEQTQTQQANLSATETAIATLLPPTATVIGPDPNATPDTVVTDEATEEPTEEMTDEATEEPTEEATEEMTSEPTEEPDGE